MFHSHRLRSRPSPPLRAPELWPLLWGSSGWSHWAWKGLILGVFFGGNPWENPWENGWKILFFGQNPWENGWKIGIVGFSSAEKRAIPIFYMFLFFWWEKSYFERKHWRENPWENGWKIG